MSDGSRMPAMAPPVIPCPLSPAQSKEEEGITEEGGQKRGKEHSLEGCEDGSRRNNGV